MTREEQFEKLNDELGMLKLNDQLDVYNDYANANHYETFRKLNYDEICSLCNDSLTTYFEQIRHSDHFDWDDSCWTIDGNGWIKSYDDIDFEYNVLCQDAVINYILDHWEQFDYYFDDDIFEDEDEEEEEE